jgi:hypothetical protein
MLLFVGCLCLGVVAGLWLNVFGLFLLSVLLAVATGVAAFHGLIGGLNVVFALLGLQAGYVIGVILPEQIGLRRERDEPEAVAKPGKAHLGIFRS